MLANTGDAGLSQATRSKQLEGSKDLVRDGVTSSLGKAPKSVAAWSDAEVAGFAAASAGNGVGK